MKASSVCIGQELFNDVKMPLWMRQLLLTAGAKAFSSTARVEVEGTPRWAAGLAAVAQLAGWR